MAETTAVQQVRDRVIQLAREIESLAQSDVPPETFFQKFVGLLVDALGARAGAVWLRDENNRLNLTAEVSLSETGFYDNPQARSLNDNLLADVLSTGETVTHTPADEENRLPTNHLLILSGLQKDRACVGAVEIFQRPDVPEEARAGYLQFVEQMCGYASQYMEQQQQSETEASDEFLEKFDRFLLQLERSLDVSEVSSAAANDGRLVLGCDRLSVAVTRGRKTTIKAISGQDTVNPRANLIRAMQTMADQVIAMGEPVTYTGRVEHLPPQIEEPLANYVQESGSRMVKLVPLFEPDPRPDDDEEDSPNRRKHEKRRRAVGCLVVEQVSESRPQPGLERRVDLVSDHVAASLNNALTHHRVFLLPLWRLLGRVLEWFHGRKLAKTLAVLAILAGIGLSLALVPMEYRVEGKGRLMPATQREVFAPWEGEVVKIHVEGGQRVEKGQPLLQLYNDELQAQLVSTESDLIEKRQELQTLQGDLFEASDKANNEKVTQLRGEIEATKVRIDGLEEQLKILKERKSKLTVRAPIDGVVASFQIEQLLMDRPVQRGEVLLEVMDATGEWRLELKVEDRRMGHLLRAQQRAEKPLSVEFILATNPTYTFEGTLQELATRSMQTKEKKNVFQAYASVNEEELPDHRIGAEVQAKIACGKRAMGYVFFGDVIETAQKFFWL